MPTTKIDREARFKPTAKENGMILWIASILGLATSFIANWISPYSGQNVWGGTIDWTAWGHRGMFILLGGVVGFITYALLYAAVKGAKRKYARMARASQGFRPGMDDSELRGLWLSPRRH